MEQQKSTSETKQDNNEGVVFEAVDTAAKTVTEKRVEGNYTPSDAVAAAVTNAEIIARDAKTPPRRYNFLKIHMDYILMVHPVSQVVFKESSKAQEDIRRFRELRNKLANTKPF